jgi:multidrug efflux pump subunit AcrA (membrane-fusion protein)
MARMKYGIAFAVLALGRTALSQTVAPVQVAPAEIRSIAEVVEGHGIVEATPSGDAEITAAAPMRVEAILVKPGDFVVKDQLLVRLARDQAPDMEAIKARINLEQARLSAPFHN